MTKNAPQAEAPAVEPITLTLHEFCARLSTTVARPELIGAFEFSERTAGNVMGTEADFTSRYETFINKLV
mgnify:FL=1